MVREDTVTISPKELRRVHVIAKYGRSGSHSGKRTRCWGFRIGRSGASSGAWSRRATRGWSIAAEGRPRIGAWRSRPRRRCCGCMRVTMGTLGRRWRWRNWPSSMGLPSARFYGYEGTIPALDSFQRYIRQDGVPLAIYADKHTTYRSPVEATVEEQRAGTTPKSQCGQAGGRWGSS
jgi:hypothetical protein